LEYDGMLLGTISAYGLTVLGSYAAVTQQSGGSFAALFVFVAVDGPVGGPPFLFVTGLGGGLGYNRELTVPTDTTQVPTFILVEAIAGAPSPADASATSSPADGTDTTTYPMSVLQQMRDAMPPKRGAFWLAAGLKFDTFVVVHSEAIVYASLDGGL